MNSCTSPIAVYIPAFCAQALALYFPKLSSVCKAIYSLQFILNSCKLQARLKQVLFLIACLLLPAWMIQLPDQSDLNMILIRSKMLRTVEAAKQVIDGAVQKARGRLLVY